MSENVLLLLIIVSSIAFTAVVYAVVMKAMYNESKLDLQPGERVLGKGYASLASDPEARTNMNSRNGCLFWTNQRLMWRPLFGLFGSPIDFEFSGISLESEAGLLNQRLRVRTDERAYRFTLATKSNREAILAAASPFAGQMNK